MSWDQIRMLREAVQTGQLSPDDAKAQLSAAIEREYGRADADMGTIDACEELLLELSGADVATLPSPEQYAAQMRRHMQPVRQRRFLMRPVWRCAAVLAAALVLALGIRLFFPPASDPAREQPLLRAQPVDVQTIRQSIANRCKDSELATDDLHEVVAFLGFVPKLPDLPEVEITSTGYRVQVEQDRILLTANYGIADAAQDTQLQYTIQYCSDADTAYMLYEQEDNGDISIIHGKVFYLAQQADRTAYTWFEGATVYRLVWEHAVA